MVVDSSRQSDWCSVVREGPEHMQVTGHRAQKVQPQVAESHDGIAKKPKSLEGEDQNALVFFPFLDKKQVWTNNCKKKMVRINQKWRRRGLLE